MSPIAVKHGKKAFWNGWSFTECPLEYAKNTALKAAWEFGWQASRRASEQQNSQNQSEERLCRDEREAQH